MSGIHEIRWIQEMMNSGGGSGIHEFHGFPTMPPTTLWPAVALAKRSFPPSNFYQTLPLSPVTLDPLFPMRYRFAHGDAFKPTVGTFEGRVGLHEFHGIHEFHGFLTMPPTTLWPAVTLAKRSFQQ